MEGLRVYRVPSMLTISDHMAWEGVQAILYGGLRTGGVGSGSPVRDTQRSPEPRSLSPP